MDEELLTRQPPQSLEAEQAVLGSILIDSRCITDVVGLVKPEDFYLQQNREIFETIYTMFNFSQTIDPVTVLDKLKELGYYHDNSKDYILQLMEITPTAANVVRYAGIVRDKAMLRGLNQAATDIQEMVSEEVGTPAEMLESAEKKIYDAISDITVSMRAEDYLEMPELICNTYKVKLTDAERKVYDELKKDMVVELGGDTVTANNAASLSNKLVQMANGAVYLNEDYIKVHNQKLDALEDMIEAASGKPVLVGYWYRHDLERIEERLRKMKVKFDRIDTDASIAAWNNRELQVGLIHPAGCGHGLNLQKGGSTMIWFGLTWSLELYQQTVGRIFRQGQVNKTVVVEHIVTEGTIDEQIMKALERKESTQNQLIDAVKAHLEV